jgi:general secretion pathway protein E
MNLEKTLSVDFGVSQSDIDKALAYQQKYGGRLEKLLVNMGSLAEDLLSTLYHRLLNVPLHQESEEEIQSWTLPNWATSLDIDLLSSCLWSPVPNAADNHFITCDPFNWEANQYLLGQGIDFTFDLASKEYFESLVAMTSQSTELSIDGLILSEVEEDKLRELATEAPTVNLLNGLFAKGVSINASDLHLEPLSGKYRVRYRVDGVLQDDIILPVSLQLAVISRIKILANMDIAEKRRPQDGKIELKISNIELDIRVSALPLGKGESIVMRFLRKDSITYNMSKLGISQDIQLKIERDLRVTSGVILLTGPTGSGKTTTLYTFLNELNSDEVKIVTLEDPIEYQLNGVNQVQINSEIGFDFSTGLRSIVRQDPDIIMVGEIRDQETARIAMQSALTGHLVFSTLHTNDAPSAFTRLIDLGVEEFLLNAAVVAVIAQRLVRKVCEKCSEKDPNSAGLVEEYSLMELVERFELKEINLQHAKGCSACANSGYKGRMSILEYMPCDKNIKRLKKDSEFLEKAKQFNAESGNRTLLEDGLLKACQGLTTVEEVLRVCA